MLIWNKEMKESMEKRKKKILLKKISGKRKMLKKSLKGKEKVLVKKEEKGKEGEKLQEIKS